MADTYRIFGSELSPYSVKVRAFFRFKGLAHDWILRSQGNMAEFQKYAKLPLIPLVVTPDGDGIQDSTPIMERFEAAHPEPGTRPDDPALRFIAELIEEYGDEWVNKPMFHYRWTYEADADWTAERIAGQVLANANADERADMKAQIKGRMVNRVGFVGSSPENRGRIEGSLDDLLAILEPHLASRRYLLGGRPSFADFGLGAQLYECSSDPTPAALMRDRAPHVLDWCNRMLDPAVEGEFESWDALAPTLEPLLSRQVGAIFLPWSTANAAAIAAGEDSMRVDLLGEPFSQTPQKYHARSLAAIRAKYAAVADKSALDPILERTGCLAALRG